MSARLFFIAAAIACATSLAATLAELPGWAFEGEDRAAFVIARDEKVRHGGKAAARIATVSAPKGYGAVIQSVEAEKFVGKRVRYSAWVRTSEVKGFVGLLVRVEGQRPDATLAFDNMQDRPVSGTSEWKQYSVVLDVGTSARRIHFGLMLSGEGTAWFDDGKLQVVDATVPTTGLKPKLGPLNSDFEE